MTKDRGLRIRVLLATLLLLFLFGGLAHSAAPNRIRRRISGGAFDPNTPLTVSGLMAWFKADAIPGLADGAAVSTWADSSGNSRDATQGTGANQPLYKVGIVGGRPVVRFDGTNDRLATAAFTIPGTFTVLAVAKNTAGSFPQNILDADNQTTQRVFQFRYNSTVLGMFTLFDTVPNAYLESNACVATNFNVLTGVRDTTSAELFVNGATDGTTAISGTPATFSMALSVGSGSLPNQFLNGDIAEGLFYSGALPVASRRKLERYLGQKYGITVI